MIVIFIYGLPKKTTQAQFEELCEETIKEVKGDKNLDLNNGKSTICVFFPSDRMNKDLGMEIVAKIDLTHKSVQNTPSVLQSLAANVAGAIEQYVVHHNVTICRQIEVILTSPAGECYHSTILLQKQ